MPKRLFDDATERAVCEYYWTRLPSGYYPSYKETAAHFGCSAPLIPRLLQRLDCPRRSQTETREGRPCKQPLERGDAPLCACGCGNRVSWSTGNKRWFKYIRGHYRPLRPYHDADWLRREYCDKNRTAQEIADSCGVTQGVILRRMTTFGIPLRTTSESLIRRGTASRERNPAWKGGVAEWDYTPDWKRICKAIKDRDKWTCQHCGEQRKRWGVHLHVHHIDGDKFNNAPDNLISLCAACHHKAHRG